MKIDPILTDRYGGALGRWIAKHVFRMDVTPVTPVTPAPAPEPVKLSPRAQAVYDRMLAGEFYVWGDTRTPKAMKELEDAGLVGTMGRVIEIKRCWVPAGTIPFELEKIRP